MDPIAHGAENRPHPYDDGRIAHIRKKDAARQPLYVHSQAVSKIAGDTAVKIGLEIAGRLAGMAHDLGKYSEAFQAYLDEIFLSYLKKLAVEAFDPDLDGDEDEIGADGQKKRIDHSSTGAQWIWQALSVPGIPGNEEEEMRQLAAQMLALVVASHHGGLIDCIAADPQHAGEDRYTRRIEKDSKETYLDEIRSSVDDEIRRELQSLLQSKELVESVRALHRRIEQIEKRHRGNKAILRCKLGLATRFLLSCLVEGDHRDSAEFENPEADKVRKDEKPDWPALSGLLENELERFSEKTDVSEIDRIRAEISGHCLEAGTRERGIYTLTVPTGGGKTLASLRFALKHAQTHEMDRIIYVIPFTSIIDQNAKVVRAILEPEGVEPESVVLEHHSNLLPEKMTWKHKLLSENWDAPVIYTTSAQFLEALFGGGTRNARWMHALAHAVLIFDEIQALPLKCAHLFANAINFLVEHAGSSVVLRTATQPLLHGIDPQKGALRLARNPELMPDVGRLFADLKRVEIIDYRKSGGWTFQEAAELGVRMQDDRVDACGCALESA